MIESNFIKMYETSFKENWNLMALTDLNETTTYTYGEVAKETARLHILFEQMGIKQGDKIALIGHNHSSWIIVFIATITYGAVIVPVLRDYHPTSMENILLHSDAKISFIDEGLWKQINGDKISHPVFMLPYMEMTHRETDVAENLQITIDEKFSLKFPNGFSADDVNYQDVSNESVVCINYISGTTNFIRGVMLTGNNYAGNMVSVTKHDLILKGEKIIAFLPLAHAFSCALDFMYSLSIGAHIHLLSKIRNTQMLFDAFHKVKPDLVSTVPLILEKIYERVKIQMANDASLRLLIKVPLLNKIVYNKIRKSLSDSFGGNFREVLVGGASFSEEAEVFLHKIKFPFSIGYGMTECAPFISYNSNKEFVAQSCGWTPKENMLARIDSEDPENIPGEIQVKGEHVMKGYYKNPEATAASFTEDGWFKTGDLGVMDKQERLYVKGMIKTMILGSNGQNIYPKAIEELLNQMPYVSESLIVGKNNRLTGLVYPDFKAMKQQNVSLLNLEKIMIDNRYELNKKLAKYEKIGNIIIMKEEFMKTEKNIIKRELYDNIEL